MLDQVRAGDIVFMCSDNSRNWGTDGVLDRLELSRRRRARALIERGISAIGFDGPSADPVDSTTYDLHRIWLSAGRMIIENVANLDQLPARARWWWRRSSCATRNGGPARILALLPD